MMSHQLYEHVNDLEVSPLMQLASHESMEENLSHGVLASTPQTPGVMFETRGKQYAVPL